MPSRIDPRIARERRDRVLSRGELRSTTQPRTSSAGVTSFAVKAEDPATREMIDVFLARQQEEAQ